MLLLASSSFKAYFERTSLHAIENSNLILWLCIKRNKEQGVSTKTADI